jgi:hypothetical protein
MLNVVTNGTVPCNYTLTITWQAMDCCSNTATCNEIVNIIDTAPPVINCSSNKVVQCGSNWSFDAPTAVDACCGTNVTINIAGTITNTSASACKTVITRTWKAVDCCSNSAACSQTVTIVDTTPPVITCASNITVNFGTPWVFTPPTAIDSCCGSNVTIVVMATVTNVQPCKVVYSRLWRAIDCCGNKSAVCISSVTVIYSPPINDPCTNPLPITLNAPYICGTTICATPSTAGSLIPTPCGNSINSPDVWYTVVAQCTGPMTVDTCAPCPGFPAYDTVLSAYTGICGSLIQVSPSACNNNACGLQSLITFNAVAGQTYRIRVSGASGAFGWFSLRAQQTSPTPPNDLCPNAIVVNVGNPAACGTTVCATPSSPGSIPTPCGNSVNTPDVWYAFTPTCNGAITINTCGACPPNPAFDTVLSVYTGTCPSLTLVPGACNNNATAGPCAFSLQSQVSFPGVAGVTYYIRVSGSGPATVGYFRLNISQVVATPPPNDLCANATAITNGVYPWNNCGANTDGPNNFGCQPLEDVWFKFTAACAGPVWINTCGSAIDTVLSVYTGNCGSLSLLGCNDNAAIGNGPCGGSLQSFLTFNALAGQTYRIRVGSPGPITGAGMLTLVGPNPPLPTCPPNIPNFCSPTNYNNWRYFRIVGNPNCIPWGWSLNAACCMNLLNTNVPAVCSGDANTLAAAFVNSINAAAAAAGCGSGLTAQASPSAPPKAGRFAICCTCTGTNAFTLSVGAAGVPPQNMCVVPNPGGYNAIPVGWCSFNPNIEEIALSGRDDNHNGIDDAVDIDLGTSQDLNGNGIPDEVEGCLVPELSSGPEAQAVQVGDTLSLTVSVSGSGPFSYQWIRNNSPLSDGGNISGATSNTMTVVAVTANDLGDYSVTVSNACGGIATAPAQISLAPPTLPVLYDLDPANGWFRFMVDTRIGYDYVVEVKNDLNDASWTFLQTATGDGSPQLIYDSEPPPEKRFYRVREVPDP